MPSQFDKITDRRPTSSVKWNFYDEDVLPMWVADMDFPAPPPILGALHGAVGHGVFGYEWPSQELLAEVSGRMARLYEWDVDAEDVVPIPGLVTGFNLAARIVCAPGEGILTQPPVYFPFLSAPENTNLNLSMCMTFYLCFLAFLIILSYSLQYSGKFFSTKIPRSISDGFSFFAFDPMDVVVFL